MVAWYSKHPWITLCLTKKKVFCIFSRYARLHKTLLFSTKYNDAFSLKGYDNMKKALENFQAHDCSESHMEAKMKWNLSTRQSIAQQLNSEFYKQQDSRRNGLLHQLTAIKFLLRQGIALREHVEKEGNLYQLLSAWTKNNDVAKSWIGVGKYMSHDIINELVTIMGQKVLHQILSKIKGQNPQWYVIIEDESTDVNYTEQFKFINQVCR